MAEWLLKVQRTDGPGAVPVGTVAWIRDRLVLGRSEAADLVLAESRVSRRHAEVRVEAEGVVVEPLGDKPVWVNRELVSGPSPLASGDWIQVGGVLLQLFAAHTQTEPSTGPMPVLSAPAAAAVLVVDPGQGTARFLGASLALRPGPFRALTHLAERVGDWVSAEDLTAAIWTDQTANPAYVPKYLSDLRAGLRPVVAAHSEAVRTWIGQGADSWTDAEQLAELDPAGLARELIKARKRVGYRLQLPAHAVTVRRG